MSFQAASKDLSRDKQFTTMTLIGGYDCNPNVPKKGVDLRVKGGVLIEKSLCVMGNINVSGIISGEQSGNVLTEKIQEAELTQGIQVCGNLILNEESIIIGDLCGNIQTAKIDEKVPGEGVCINGNLTVNGNVLADNITGVTLASAGGDETLVQDGVGPDLVIKGLTAGEGIQLTGSTSNVTISSTVMSTVMIAYAEGNELNTALPAGTPVDMPFGPISGSLSSNSPVTRVFGSPTYFDVTGGGGLYLVHGILTLNTASGSLTTIQLYDIDEGDFIYQQATPAGIDRAHIMYIGPLFSSSEIYLRAISAGGGVNMIKTTFTVQKLV